MTDFRTIETASYAKVKPPSSLGRPPKLEWLSIKQLVIDPEYQRDIAGEGRTNVRRITENFNWSMFSPVIVAGVGGNKFAIIDGQHRTTAAALCGVDKVPCQVIEAKRGEQAAAFRAINGNTIKLSSMQLHHAAAAAGDETAILVNKVCAGADCSVLRYPKPWNHIQPGETMAIVAIRRSIKRFGADIVTTAMRCIRESGDGNPGMLRTQTIFGAAEVLHDHPEWVEQGSDLLNAFDNFDVASNFDDAVSRAKRGTSITEQFEGLLVAALAEHFAKLPPKKIAGVRR